MITVSTLRIAIDAREAARNAQEVREEIRKVGDEAVKMERQVSSSGEKTGGAFERLKGLVRGTAGAVIGILGTMTVAIALTKAGLAGLVVPVVLLGGLFGPLGLAIAGGAAAFLAWGNGMAAVRARLAPLAAMLAPFNSLLLYGHGALLAIAGSAKLAALGLTAILAAVAALLISLAALVAIGAAVVTVFVKSVAAGDKFTASIGKINAATGNLKTSNEVYSALYQNALKLGTSVDQSTGAFSRFAIAARQIGATNGQVIQLIQTIQKAGIASGSSVEEISSASIQLGQALASGRLQGDELRAILESMPLLADELAKNLGTNIGQLRKMGSEGKLTSDMIFKGLLASSGAIEKRFNDMPTTMARSFGMVKTAWGGLLAEIDKSTGASQWIARMLQRFAKAIESMRIMFYGLWNSGATGDLIYYSLLSPFAKVVNWFAVEFQVAANMGSDILRKGGHDLIAELDAMSKPQFWAVLGNTLEQVATNFGNAIIDKVNGAVASIATSTTGSKLFGFVAGAITPDIPRLKGPAPLSQEVIEAGRPKYSSNILPSADYYRQQAGTPFDIESIEANRVAAGLKILTKMNEAAMAGSSMKGGEDTDNIKAIADEEASKKALSEMKKREDEMRAYHADTMNLLTNQNATYFDAFKLGIGHTVEAWGSAMQQIHDLGKGITENMATSIGGALSAMAMGTKDLKEGFNDMAASIIGNIIQMIIQLTIQLALQQALGMAVGGGGGGSIIGAMQMAMNAVPKGEGYQASLSGQPSSTVTSLGPQDVSQAEMDLADTPMRAKVAKRGRISSSLRSMVNRGDEEDTSEIDAMRASIGAERVSAADRVRAREGSTATTKEETPIQVNVNIVNVTNPNEVPEYIANNPDSIVNAIGKRAPQVRRQLNQDGRSGRG